MRQWPDERALSLKTSVSLQKLARCCKHGAKQGGYAASDLNQ
jgi:hypothetical protein